MCLGLRLDFKSCCVSVGGVLERNELVSLKLSYVGYYIKFVLFTMLSRLFELSGS
jgi:hypothetical protein